LKERKSTKKEKRSSGKPVSVYEESIRNAMKSYIGGRGFLNGFSRRIDLLEKPRFLVAGRPDAGKTSLLAKSGVPLDCVYPDGHAEGGHDMPGWFFSEKAVYIDVPGALTAPRQWNEFCGVLKKKRGFLRGRAVDGLIFVVDIRELMTMDNARVGELAAELREQADILVSITGYKLPLYFIFNKLDKFEGFRELFSDKKAVERIPTAGALVDDSESERPPMEIFASRFREIYDAVSDLCLLKMLNAENVEKSRPLCRFQSELALAETRISAFLAEFFKKRGRATPRFGGFFLTSNGIDGARGQSSFVDDSASHNRTASRSNRTVYQNKSFFSNKLLNDTIPNARFRVKAAGEGTALHVVKKICFHLLLTAILAIALFFFAGSGMRDALHMRTLRAELSTLFDGDPAMESRYMALEKLRLSYDYLRGGFFRSPGRLIFGTDKARGKVMDAYVAASAQIIVNPAAKYLETAVSKQKTGRPGELTTEEHQTLYRSLETYLLLTSGNQAKPADAAQTAENLEAALKNSLGQRYKSLDEKIVRANVNAVIKLASDGRYESRANEQAVQAAREKLTAAPRAGAVYNAVIRKLSTPRRDVPLNRIIGKGDILRNGRDVSALYTREGWEQHVYNELVTASKDPFKTDWVMGPVKARVDESKLLSELVTLYTDDLCRRWLDYVRNSVINLSPDASTLARDLERLASRDSEAKRMLTVVCSLATQPPAALAAPTSAPTSVAGIKDQINSVSNKLRGGVSAFTHNTPDPFVEARKTFGPIEAFLTGGAFDQYLGDLGALSEKIKSCDERGGFAQTFAVRGDDPLKTCRNQLTKACANMPAAASAPLKRVLEAPLELAAGVLAKKVSAELEESWASEVASHFNERLAGRYPLDKNGADPSWSDFEEFFKPQSGILWKYIDKNLSGLMERTPRGWEAVPPRSLSLRLPVGEEALRCCNRAEKIAAAFFDRNGTPRRQEIAFYPFASTSGDVQFFIGDKRLEFHGGQPIPTSRPQGSGDETVILRLTTADKAQEELAFRGEWGMARLFNAGKIEKLGSDRYRINWRLNVRNIYTANITGVVQSNMEGLFDESVARGFAVPKSLFKD